MTLGPYAEGLGIQPVEGSTTQLRLLAGPETGGRPGFLHGGVIAALLEAAAYRAVMAAIAAAGDGPAGIKPVTLTTDFLRGGRLVETFAEGRVTRLGTRIANVDVEAWQVERDRPIAGARMTLRIKRD